MGRVLQSILSFNRGIISKLGLARLDVKRLQLAASIQTNLMPRVLGSMMLRPGFQYIGSILGNNPARLLPFIFSATDTAIIELTDSNMRVWVDDVLVTRNFVSTAVTNGNFATDLSGWTQNDQADTTSSWVAPNYMQLVGNGSNRAIRDQEVTVTGSQNKEHGLRIVIARGPVSLRIGSFLGDDSYISETILYAGSHSLAFTPTGNFWIRFFSSQQAIVWVAECTIEAVGVMQLPTVWTADDISNVRIDQSADVLFCCDGVHQQQRIERRSKRSWSAVVYQTISGPFNVQNITPLTMAVSSVADGNIELTSSDEYFKPAHVGALFTLTSVGQTIDASIAAQNTFSDPIEIEGVGTSRTFAITISGTFSGTVVLQGSIASNVGPWADVATGSWTAPYVGSYNDTLDNQIIYYRIGIETGNYVSGTAVCSLSIGTGTIVGVLRVTDYIDNMHVDCEVITQCGSVAPTSTWSESQWSDLRGWPSSVVFHQGRLWWAGKSNIWGSISDSYNDFDPTFLGDAGTINIQIAQGQVDTINWMIDLQRMCLGGQTSEFAVTTNIVDDPLTPTNFQVRAASTQGSSAVRALKIDMHGVFVGRTGNKVFSLDMGTNYPFYDYVPNDMTALVPDLVATGQSITRIDHQRAPDTRIHCVRSDGVALVAVNDKNEDVLAWIQIQTSGNIEDVVVLPALTGQRDDQVYYVVNRIINGERVRYLEKMAQESDCRGDLPFCNLADSYMQFSSGTAISGLDHLEGQKVVVWGNGTDIGTDDSVSPWQLLYTVADGQITLSAAAENIVVGLPYSGQFQSTKLGTATQDVQSPLNMQKKINHIGLIMADVHPKGLQYGPSFDYMDDMPSIEEGAPVGTAIRSEYDENTIEFPGTWTTDSRVCLQAQAPRPVTVLAVTLDMEINN